MKNTNHFASSLLALALGSLSFADEGLQAGSSGVANGTTLDYPFSEDLQKIIMDSIKESDQVTLGDAAVDNVDAMDETNPVWSLSERITTRFAEYLTEKGIDPESFDPDTFVEQGTEEAAHSAVAGDQE